jgi:5-methylcytosine-specific restriction endonuclease McrA
MKRTRRQNRRFKMTRLEYRNEYLKSDEWKSLREDFLNTRDGNCEKCSKPASDVHHMEYKFLSTPSDQMNSLMLLCRNCHTLTHKAIECKAIKFPHHKCDVLRLTEDHIKNALSRSRKKHLVSIPLIREIVERGSSHGIKMACGVLKVRESFLCSIPPNLKATSIQIEKLNWIARTKPVNKAKRTYALPKKPKSQLY